MVLGLKDLGILALRVLIALMVAAIAAPQMAFAELSDEEYWNNTRISISDLQDMINTKNCYKNADQFLGCVAAINSLLETSSPSKILSNKQIETLPEMKNTVGIIEGVQIKIHETESTQVKNIAQSWGKFIEKRSQSNKSWRGVYQVTQQKPLSIEKLLQYALESSAKAQEKYQLARAINAYYMNAVDPHTYITPLAKFKASTAKSEEQISGVGMSLSRFDQTYLLTPFEDSAAARAGVQENDILVSVNGKDISGMPAEEVTRLIKGPAGTSVVLGILRHNQPLTIEIERSIYIIKNISGKLIEDPITKRKVGYIQLNSFMEDGVCSKFISIAKNLHTSGAENLILDLRYNSGGLVNEAVCIASSYLNKDDVVITENDPQTNAIKSTHRARGGFSVYNLYNKKPLFVLLNQGSASASEMLAGALSTHYKAIVVGVRSYGKGTMQATLFDAMFDTFRGYILRKTTARFHFASGASNQLIGIQPDIEVYSNPNPSEEDKFAIREADLYPNAIAPSKALNGFPKAGIDGIKACMAKRAVISERHSINLQSNTVVDYQLRMAREAAACQFSRK